MGSVGAGIRLAPNMARILDRLGAWADVEREAVELKDTSIGRKYLIVRSQCYLLTRKEGDEDKELAHVDLQYIRETHGYLIWLDTGLHLLALFMRAAREKRRLLSTLPLHWKQQSRSRPDQR